MKKLPLEELVDFSDREVSEEDMLKRTKEFVKNKAVDFHDTEGETENIQRFLLFPIMYNKFTVLKYLLTLKESQVNAELLNRTAILGNARAYRYLIPHRTFNPKTELPKLKDKVTKSKFFQSAAKNLKLGSFSKFLDL